MVYISRVSESPLKEEARGLSQSEAAPPDGLLFTLPAAVRKRFRIRDPRPVSPAFSLTPTGENQAGFPPGEKPVRQAPFQKKRDTLDRLRDTSFTGGQGKKTDLILFTFSALSRCTFACHPEPTCKIFFACFEIMCRAFFSQERNRITAGKKEIPFQIRTVPFHFLRLISSAFFSLFTDGRKGNSE